MPRSRAAIAGAGIALGRRPLIDFELAERAARPAVCRPVATGVVGLRHPRPPRRGARHSRKPPAGLPAIAAGRALGEAGKVRLALLHECPECLGRLGRAQAFTEQLEFLLHTPCEVGRAVPDKVLGKPHRLRR